MQQHPLPQNISSYEFRLIGDMTLKQFLQLLGGGVVAFIFFSTNLPGLIKWFFVAMSVIFGAAFAFLPLEGRTLDKWLMAFIRAIYKPTQFHWKKNPKLPDYLSDEVQIKTPSSPVTIQPKKSKHTKHEKALNEQESTRVDQINQLFSSSPKATAVTKPATTPQPNTPVPTPTVNQTATPISKALPNQKPTTPIPQKTVIPKSNQHQSVSVQTTPLETVKVVSKKPPDAPKPEPKAAQPTVISGTISPTTQAGNNVVTAKLNPDLPFPSLPETKNTLVGMVFSKEGKIVDNAIIEIQDQTHRTVRATKTNKIGQFFLATPLNTGSYFIKTEKKDLIFPTISIQLEDRIYPPLEIRSE